MPVLVKRYANRKLYNTQTSRYITLKGIADLLDQDEEVRVIDNETGEDITSITLSQILVDTERSNRAVPGSLLSGLLQRGGDLYGALRRGMDEAGEGLEGIQRNVRRLLGREGEEGERGDWIAFTPPDLDRMVQRTLERVLRMLDLPRRSDIEALSERLDRVATALESWEERQGGGSSGSGRSPEVPGPRSASASAPEPASDASAA
jgi:polyhydroxyalkanoate synthesis repressor PhaR